MFRNVNPAEEVHAREIAAFVSFVHEKLANDEVAVRLANLRASIIAWLAPYEPVRYIVRAASPRSATRSSRRIGTGSRSIIEFSRRHPHRG